MTSRTRRVAAKAATQVTQPELTQLTTPQDEPTQIGHAPLVPSTFGTFSQGAATGREPPVPFTGFTAPNLTDPDADVDIHLESRGATAPFENDDRDEYADGDLVAFDYSAPARGAPRVEQLNTDL